MTSAELFREIAKKDEIISELKAEILELKVERELDTLEEAIEIVNECRDEENNVDYDILSERHDRMVEIAMYLETYIMFHDKGELEVEED